MATRTVSAQDEAYLRTIRANVARFVARCAAEHDRPGTLLDVAPQDHEGAAAHFKRVEIRTLDIDPASGADYIADLCQSNRALIPDATFDAVLCTEVLEHTLNPFDAVREVRRMLKPAGLLFLSVPFNFRIHGPLPDCWRFTEHGLRALLKDFEIRSLDELATEDRWLMPVQYTVVAAKPASARRSLIGRASRLPAHAPAGTHDAPIPAGRRRPSRSRRLLLPRPARALGSAHG
jgi:SAM-dependent methyltransferase